MVRLGLLVLLSSVLVACSVPRNLPEPSLLYDESYDVVFAAAVEAATAARVGNVSLPVTRVDAEAGIVQLHGDPLGEGVDHAVAIVVATTADGRTVVVVRSGSSGPSDGELSAMLARRVIEELDARLTRVQR